MLTVGMLRDFIRDLDEDTPVVIGHEDHSYYQATFEIVKAERLDSKYYAEYFSKEDMTDPNNQVVEVVVFE